MFWPDAAHWTLGSLLRKAIPFSAISSSSPHCHWAFSFECSSQLLLKWRGNGGRAVPGEQGARPKYLFPFLLSCLPLRCLHCTCVCRVMNCQPQECGGQALGPGDRSPHSDVQCGKRRPPHNCSSRSASKCSRRCAKPGLILPHPQSRLAEGRW